MPLIRRSPLKRSTVRLKRTAIKKLGKRGREGIRLRKEAREIYFGNDFGALCQICGLVMKREEADAAHKLKRSLGAGNEIEEVLIAHGFRCGPVNCHAWLDEPGKKERQKAAQEAPENAKRGGTVDWGTLTKELIEWLDGTKTGQPAHYWRRSGI